MNVGKLIVDYIETVYPDWQSSKAEIYNEALQGIHFLASRDWGEYE